MCPSKFEIFSIFPNFLRSLSLKSFGNSWGNSYNKFAILDIKFRFTCVESDLYQNIFKFPNIMTRIVGWRKVHQGNCFHVLIFILFIELIADFMVTTIRNIKSIYIFLWFWITEVQLFIHCTNFSNHFNLIEKTSINVMLLESHGRVDHLSGKYFRKN